MDNYKKASDDTQSIIKDYISIASGIGTLISVPSYLILYSTLSSTQLAAVGGFAIFAFFTFAIRFVVLRFKNKSAVEPEEYVELGSDKDGEFQKNWSYTSHHSILDFLDEDGKEVDCTVEIELKCLIPCQKFYHRVGPANKVHDLHAFGGTMGPKTYTADYVEFVVDFNKILVVGESIHLKLSYKLINSFLDELEYWKMKKYYSGNNYKITAILPAKRPAKGIYLSIVPSYNIMKRINTMECMKYNYLNNRPTIEVIEDKGKLKINDELLLEWHW